MIRSTREALRDRVAALGTPAAKAVVELVNKKGPNGAVACWGAISDEVKKTITDDASLEALWKGMVEDGDPRPQLVLLNIIKDRPKLVSRALQDQGNVSPVVRQALQALGDPKDTEAVRGFKTRVSELLAVRYSVPDAVEPENESKRRSK
jgi:hypothetical protein